MQSVSQIPRSCSESLPEVGCGARKRQARSPLTLRLAALAGLTTALLAGCASAPPAPIEARTTPAGGHLSASVPNRPTAPVVSARPSSAAPVQAARPAAASGASAPGGASATGQPSRPTAAGGTPRPSLGASAAPAASPDSPTGTQVQTTPLATPALESRALESRPLEARPLPPAAAPAAANAAGSASTAAPQDRNTLDFAWPVPGRVLQPYSETGKGITLSGNAGDPVFSAADGRVIFSGNGPRGYGNLIIVKHPNDLLSVYAHNRKLLVKEGQNVTRGERIAELGDTGGSTPRLLFEIRRQGKPIDPIPLLPRR